MRKEGGQPGNKNAQKWTEKSALKIGNGLIKWMNEKNENIFFEEYLMGIDLYRGLVSYLCETYPSFSKLIKNAKQIQEHKINKYSIANKLNPTMSIFLLKNIHGYRDVRDHSHEVTIPSITYEHVRSKSKDSGK